MIKYQVGGTERIRWSFLDKSMVQEGSFCVLSIAFLKHLAVATVMGRRGISPGLTLYWLLCSYGLTPKPFSLLEGPLLIFFKIYSALKEQFYLHIFYVPIYFMGLQLKFFLLVYQTAVYRTVHLDIFLSYRLINCQIFFSLFLLCVGQNFLRFIGLLGLSLSLPYSSM